MKKKNLKPEVKEKLELIVNKFVDSLKEDNVDLSIKDVIIVGSNANYNYSDKSDIDLHIIADLSIYKDKEDLAEIIYNAYRRIFNDKFDPTIKGHEVEIYVEPDEDVNNDSIPDQVNHIDEAVSNGVYSLYNGWIKEPVKDDVPADLDLEPELSDWVEKSKASNSIEDITKFIDDIYKLRQESILNDGEYGKGNLIFKELRNRGILQELKDKKVSLENKEMSLESLKEELNYVPELEEKLFDKYLNMGPLDKSDLDDIWEEIVSEYDDLELAESVCAELEIYLDDLYAESIKPETIKEDEVINESELFRQKNENCIKEYRQWAGLSDEEEITEDTINEWALNRVSCNNNYDYNDLKDVLLGR